MITLSNSKQKVHLPVFELGSIIEVVFSIEKVHAVVVFNNEE